MIPEHRHLMTHALRDGVLVHIDDVTNGNSCNCVCPACKQPLMARQGETYAHHFAHQSNQVCQYGYETSLHYMAKEIIQQAKQFLLPPVCIPLGPRRSKTIQGARMVSVRNVELEQRLGGIIPDIVLYTDGQPVLVEIYVTHPVDEKKKEKIRKIDLPMIEIDLSQVTREVTREALTEILLQKESQKKWVHCTDKDLKQALPEKPRQQNNLESQKRYSITTKQKCPKCGSKMKLAFGRTGYFWGCEQFPKCKGSRPLSTYQRLLMEGKCPVCLCPLSEYQGEKTSGLQCGNTEQPPHRFSIDGTPQPYSKDELDLIERRQRFLRHLIS